MIALLRIYAMTLSLAAFGITHALSTAGGDQCEADDEDFSIQSLIQVQMHLDADTLATAVHTRAAGMVSSLQVAADGASGISVAMFFVAPVIVCGALLGAVLLSQATAPDLPMKGHPDESPQLFHGHAAQWPPTQAHLQNRQFAVSEYGSATNAPQYSPERFSTSGTAGASYSVAGSTVSLPPRAPYMQSSRPPTAANLQVGRASVGYGSAPAYLQEQHFERASTVGYTSGRPSVLGNLQPRISEAEDLMAAELRRQRHENQLREQRQRLEANLSFSMPEDFMLGGRGVGVRPGLGRM